MFMELVFITLLCDNVGTIPESLVTYAQRNYFIRYY